MKNKYNVLNQRSSDWYEEWARLNRKYKKVNLNEIQVGKKIEGLLWESWELIQTEVKWQQRWWEQQITQSADKTVTLPWQVVWSSSRTASKCCWSDVLWMYPFNMPLCFLQVISSRLSKFYTPVTSRLNLYYFLFLIQDIGADELSECVQDFYQNLSERLQTQFKGAASLLHPTRICFKWKILTVLLGMILI